MEQTNERDFCEAVSVVADKVLQVSARINPAGNRTGAHCACVRGALCAHHAQVAIDLQTAYLALSRAARAIGDAQ